MKKSDPFNVKDIIKTNWGEITYFSLKKLEDTYTGKISRLPYSMKILLEAILRKVDGELITEEDVKSLAQWNPDKLVIREIPFIPTRVILQDFTGIPAMVDLTAMRSAMQRCDGDVDKINPIIPVDLVIDHSIQVDYYRTSYARSRNEEKEFERNSERYSFLRWAQETFNNFRVVPPGTGIVHQVNLEYLASVIQLKKVHDELVAYPDSLVGTDSHTTMINSLGVLGWGVGGIEAEAVMLGQPYYMMIPSVVGFKLYGELREGITATDLVLTATQILRDHGVVGKFVEFFGPGLDDLSIPDRATIANMAPEYGATIGFFPIDSTTVQYLLDTGRNSRTINLITKYAKKQGLFRTDQSLEPIFSDVLELDLSTIKPSLAGPKRPQDRIPLVLLKKRFHEVMKSLSSNKSSIIHITDHDRWFTEGGSCNDAQLPEERIPKNNGDNVGKHREDIHLSNGSIVIAAITSCTNTSNPAVMIGAGIAAKKAVEHGLKVKPYIKTSLAPGSRVVLDYLHASDLLQYLETLGFHLVGYGCTTCIGNSGPLPERVAEAINKYKLNVAAILSGNRNFEGRIHPLVKLNYLASPPLVIAYALAGTINIDLRNEPLGYDPNNQPVYLKDIWPKNKEIQELQKITIKREMFIKQYKSVFKGTKNWLNLMIPDRKLFQWTQESTYIREPPFLKDFKLKPIKKYDIIEARVLALLGDSITTDHISPAGTIPLSSPAGQYLISHGVDSEDFNSYGSRRGNHEVMMRGTFANIRLRNKLTPDKEGGGTLHHPSNKEMTIYNAAMHYIENNIPLIIIAGKEYGSGSSRDWAAKGTHLLGVKAVIAESYERIHKSNLVGMSILPLQFKNGENVDRLGLKGDETYSILGIKELYPKRDLTVEVRNTNGKKKNFSVSTRLDSPIEIDYYRNGGILQTVLRKLLKYKDPSTDIT